jgi:hypothetical protein
MKHSAKRFLIHIHFTAGSDDFEVILRVLLCPADGAHS